jgi:hypothetical protein
VLSPSLEVLPKVEKELATTEKLAAEATVGSRVAGLNVEIAKVNATAFDGPPRCPGTLNVVRSWRSGGGSAPPILGSSSAL